MSKTEKRVALVANAYLLERDALRVELDAMRQRAEAAERERDELRVALVGGCEDRDTDEGEYYEHGMVG